MSFYFLKLYVHTVNKLAIHDFCTTERAPTCPVSSKLVKAVAVQANPQPNANPPNVTEDMKKILVHNIFHKFCIQ